MYKHTITYTHSRTPLPTEVKSYCDLICRFLAHLGSSQYALLLVGSAARQVIFPDAPPPKDFDFQVIMPHCGDAVKSAADLVTYLNPALPLFFPVKEGVSPPYSLKSGSDARDGSPWVDLQLEFLLRDYRTVKLDIQFIFCSPEQFTGLDTYISEQLRKRHMTHKATAVKLFHQDWDARTQRPIFDVRLNLAENFVMTYDAGNTIDFLETHPNVFAIKYAVSLVVEAVTQDAQSYARLLAQLINPHLAPEDLDAFVAEGMNAPRNKPIVKVSAKESEAKKATRKVMETWAKGEEEKKAQMVRSLFTPSGVPASVSVPTGVAGAGAGVARKSEDELLKIARAAKDAFIAAQAAKAEAIEQTRQVAEAQAKAKAEQEQALAKVAKKEAKKARLAEAKKEKAVTQVVSASPVSATPVKALKKMEDREAKAEATRARQAELLLKKQAQADAAAALEAARVEAMKQAKAAKKASKKKSTQTGKAVAAGAGAGVSIAEEDEFAGFLIPVSEKPVIDSTLRQEFFQQVLMPSLPLHTWLAKQDPPVVAELLTLRDHRGYTALELTIIYGQLEKYLALLNVGAIPDARACNILLYCLQAECNPAATSSQELSEAEAVSIQLMRKFNPIRAISVDEKFNVQVQKVALFGMLRGLGFFMAEHSGPTLQIISQRAATIDKTLRPILNLRSAYALPDAVIDIVPNARFKDLYALLENLTNEMGRRKLGNFSFTKIIELPAYGFYCNALMSSIAVAGAGAMSQSVLEHALSSEACTVDDFKQLEHIPGFNQGVDELPFELPLCLRLALYHKRFEIMHYLVLKDHSLPNQVFEEKSIFFLACEAGVPADLIEHMIEHDANLNWTFAVHQREQLKKPSLFSPEDAELCLTHHFVTPLMIAARWEHTEIVATLLRLGANPNQFSALPLPSALFEAVGTGNEEIVRLLLDAGADRYKVNEHGLPALFYAASFNHFHLVPLLYPAGEVGYDASFFAYDSEDDAGSDSGRVDPMEGYRLSSVLNVDHGPNVIDTFARLSALPLSLEGFLPMLLELVSLYLASENHDEFVKTLYSLLEDPLHPQHPLCQFVIQGNIGAIIALFAAGIEVKGFEQNSDFGLQQLAALRMLQTGGFNHHLKRLGLHYASLFEKTPAVERECKAPEFTEAYSRAYHIDKLLSSFLPAVDAAQQKAEAAALAYEDMMVPPDSRENYLWKEYVEFTHWKVYVEFMQALRLAEVDLNMLLVAELNRGNPGFEPGVPSLETVILLCLAGVEPTAAHLEMAFNRKLLAIGVILRLFNAPLLLLRKPTDTSDPWHYVAALKFDDWALEPIFVDYNGPEKDILCALLLYRVRENEAYLRQYMHHAFLAEHSIDAVICRAAQFSSCKNLLNDPLVFEAFSEGERASLTPVSWALISGRVSLLKRLLSNGASYDQASTMFLSDKSFAEVLAIQPNEAAQARVNNARWFLELWIIQEKRAQAGWGADVSAGASISAETAASGVAMAMPPLSFYEFCSTMLKNTKLSVVSVFGMSPPPSISLSSPEGDNAVEQRKSP